MTIGVVLFLCGKVALGAAVSTATGIAAAQARDYVLNVWNG